MPRFVFQFESLLKMRIAAEREHQTRVAQLERQRLELEAHIRGAQNEIRSHKHDLRELLEGSARKLRTSRAVDTRTVRLQANASLHAQARTQHLAVKLAGLYTRLEEARAALNDAASRRRAVELLKQRRFEAWQRTQRKREDAEIDEIGTQRAGRNAVRSRSEPAL